MEKQTNISGKDLPTTEQLRKELQREKHRHNFAVSLRSTLVGLVTVAAAAILVAVLLLPVLRIYGSSMNPSLSEGDIVLSLKGGDFETGDVIAFYYNTKVLAKRVIAQAGEWVNIDADGNVYVNNRRIEEPYLTEAPALGDCNIPLPYQVPESKLFVMGDNRSVSVDSRNTAVGCVAEEQIVGKVAFCVWPLNHFGMK